MQRHIIDRPDNGHSERSSTRRLREFLKLERHMGRHPAVKMLHSSRSVARGGSRVSQFLRIDQGRTV